MSAPYKGQSNTKGIPGIIGENTNAGDGVWGQANMSPKHDAGRGVVGVSDAGTGVWGDTQTGRAMVGVVRVKGDAVWGETASGRGVVGVSQGEGVGVWGDTHTGRAVVGVVRAKGDAVWGETKLGRGVVGVSGEEGTGVWGVSEKGDGVHGETKALTWVAAVSGVALNPEGIGPGVSGESIGGPGVFGKAAKDAGVIGFHGDPRLQETTVANDGARAGVFGASDIGAGVLGYSRDPNSPAVFAFGGFRALAFGKRLAGWFQGDVQVDGDIFVTGADCAEDFDLAEGELCEPGTVMVIEEGGTLRPCTQAYDKKAAGVVSGAGSFRAGMILDKQPSKENRFPIALIGKVYCKVDARSAPIEVGDTLTTSPTKGHAMKADDPGKAFGAVIGKALHALSDGQGFIPILVALQ